jgi:hypothetical protein
MRPREPWPDFYLLGFTPNHQRITQILRRRGILHVIQLRPVYSLVLDRHRRSYSAGKRLVFIVVVAQNPSDAQEETETYRDCLEGRSRGEVFETATVIAVARHGGVSNGDMVRRGGGLP